MAKPGPEFKIRVFVAELPFKEAASTVPWVLATVPAVAVKTVEEEPAGMRTDAGMLRAELLEPRVTTDPPAGARSVRMSVQLLEPPATRLVGAHASELSPGTETSVFAVIVFAASALDPEEVRGASDRLDVSVLALGVNTPAGLKATVVAANVTAV